MWSRLLSIGQVVVVVVVVVVLFCFVFVFFLFIVGVDKNTKKNDAAILTEQAWSIKDLFCGQKENFFY